MLRLCNRCYEYKEVNEINFARAGTYKDKVYFDKYCRSCKNKTISENLRLDPIKRQKKKEADKKYSQQNRKRIRHYHTLWSKVNKDKIKQYCLNRSVEVVQKIKLANKLYKHKRRQKEHKGNISTKEWLAKVEAHEYKCLYCEKTIPLDELHMEHMQPLSRGGEHEISNVVPSCASCNWRKGSKTYLEFVEQLSREKEEVKNG